MGYLDMRVRLEVGNLMSNQWLDVDVWRRFTLHPEDRRRLKRFDTNPENNSHFNIVMNLSLVIS
jgi:hypothetical protein